jgi:hypothetical protein
MYPPRFASPCSQTIRTRVLRLVSRSFGCWTLENSAERGEHPLARRSSRCLIKTTRALYRLFISVNPTPIFSRRVRFAHQPPNGTRNRYLFAA